MLEVDFINKTKEKIEDWEVLSEQLLSFAIKILKIKHNITLSITFLESKEAHELNLKYRNKSYIPDVTSFPTNMSDSEIKILRSQEVGDIFICIEEAKRKAIKYNHTIKEEMSFLFVHGFLHLLGYDHETNLDDEKEMFDLQDCILRENGIKYEIKFVAEDYEEEGVSNV